MQTRTIFFSLRKVVKKYAFEWFVWGNKNAIMRGIKKQLFSLNKSTKKCLCTKKRRKSSMSSYRKKCAYQIKRAQSHRIKTEQWGFFIDKVFSIPNKLTGHSFKWICAVSKESIAQMISTFLLPQFTLNCVDDDLWTFRLIGFKAFYQRRTKFYSFRIFSL